MLAKLLGFDPHRIGDEDLVMLRDYILQRMCEAKDVEQEYQDKRNKRAQKRASKMVVQEQLLSFRLGHQKSDEKIRSLEEQSELEKNIAAV